jgi:hypothetical protein
MKGQGESGHVVITIGDSWTKETIGYETRQAEMVGHFAITKGYRNKSSWTITHAPTGWSAGQGFKSKASARRAISALAPLADWSFTEPTAVMEWPDELREQIRQILAKERA